MSIILLAAALVAGPAEAKVEAIRDRLVADVRACGRVPPPTPTMVADDKPGLTFYVPDDNSVHYPDFATIAAPIRESFAVNAAAAPGRPTTEQYFTDVFQSLLVPHELGHWLESAGKQDLSWWESEYRANRIALAYWRLHTPDRDLLPRLTDYWAHEVARPGPVPPGQDVPTFFNASQFDPTTYGWFQSEMMRRAWAARNDASFCALVEQQWPRKPG